MSSVFDNSAGISSMIPVIDSSISEMLFFSFFLSPTRAETVNRVYLALYPILKF